MEKNYSSTYKIYRHLQQVQNNNTEDAMPCHIFFIKFPETDNKIDAQLFRFFTNNLGNVKMNTY